MLAGLQGKARVLLRVNIGEEVRIAVVGLDACGEFVAEEPRLGERDDEVASKQTVLGAGTETLATAGEVRPVENVEVGLLEFRKSDEAVDGAEARAEVERACALLLDDHIEILAAGDDGICGLGLDAGEVVQVVEAFLAEIDECGVKDIAGFDGEFAADHPIASAGVALDIDEIEKRLDAFVDAVGDIHCPWAGGENLRDCGHIHIAAAAVEIAHGLEVIAHAFRSEKLAVAHFQLTEHFALRDDIHAVHTDFVDAVLGALANGHEQLHALAGERLGLNFLHIDIGETTVLIKGLNGGPVFLHLGRHEATALVKKSQEIERFRRHHFPDVAGEDGIVADEGDFADDEFGAFGNAEDHAGAILTGNFLDAVLHIDLGVVAVLIEFEDFLAVLLDALFIDDIAGFHLEVSAHAVEGNLLSAFNDDLLDDRSALEENGHANAVAKRLGEETDIRHATGRIESAHILLGRALAVRLADFCGQVGEHTILGNTRRADRFDHNVIDDRPHLIRLRVDRGGQKENGQEGGCEGQEQGKITARVFHGEWVARHGPPRQRSDYRMPTGRSRNRLERFPETRRD